MTVRNIRAHQTRGLLPPPVVRGRTGYYNEEHVARIALTREMQADGLNLEAIRRVLETSDGAATEIFDFTRALRAPFEDEAPEIVEAEELAGRLETATRPTPSLLRAGRKAGHPARPARRPDRGDQPAPAARRRPRWPSSASAPRAPCATAEKLRRHADGVARTFVDLFVKEIWQPFDRAGRPEADWPKIREALERMRPLASDALLAVFQIAMGEAVEKASERTLRVSARRKKRS